MGSVIYPRWVTQSSWADDKTQEYTGGSRYSYQKRWGSHFLVQTGGHDYTTGRCTTQNYKRQLNMKRKAERSHEDEPRRKQSREYSNIAAGETHNANGILLNKICMFLQHRNETYEKCYTYQVDAPDPGRGRLNALHLPAYVDVAMNKIFAMRPQHTHHPNVDFVDVEVSPLRMDRICARDPVISTLTSKYTPTEGFQPQNSGASPIPPKCIKIMTRMAQREEKHKRDKQRTRNTEPPIAILVRAYKCISTAFIVLKKMRNVGRFILNAKYLTRYDLEAMQVGPPENLPRLQDIDNFVWKWNTCIVADFKNYFFQITIKGELATYCCFRTHSGILSMRRMPQGLGRAPTTAQRCTKVILERAQLCERALYIYDDVIVGATSSSMSTRDKQMLGESCDYYNATLNQAKTFLTGSAKATFYGHDLNLEDKTIQLDEEWRQQVIQHTPTQTQATLAHWSEVGTALWAIRVQRRFFREVDAVITFCSQIAKAISAGTQTWDTTVTRSTDVQDQIEQVWAWIRENTKITPPRNQRRDETMHIYSDASGKYGLGLVLPDGNIHIEMQPEDCPDINIRETAASLLAAYLYAGEHENMHIRMHIDNAQGVHWIQHGMSPHKAVNIMIQNFEDECKKKDHTWEAIWVPRGDNEKADKISKRTLTMQDLHVKISGNNAQFVEREGEKEIKEEQREA